MEAKIGGDTSVRRTESATVYEVKLNNYATPSSSDPSGGDIATRGCSESTRTVSQINALTLAEEDPLNELRAMLIVGIPRRNVNKWSWPPRDPAFHRAIHAAKMAGVEVVPAQYLLTYDDDKRELSYSFTRTIPDTRAHNYIYDED